MTKVLNTITDLFDRGTFTARVGAVLLLIALCLAVATAAAQEAKVTTLMTQELAGKDGKEGTMQLVEYAPGGSDAAHRHNASVFVYVLEGALVMQVKGGEGSDTGAGPDIL